MKGSFAPFIVLPVIIIYLRMTYALLIEKEKKIREGMKIMGMSNLSFYLSWIIYYVLIYTVCALGVALVLNLTVFPESDYSVMLFIIWLFYMTLVFQSLFISVFFTRAKMGNVVAMVSILPRARALLFPHVRLSGSCLTCNRSPPG